MKQLCNSNECRHTTTEELFPTSHRAVGGNSSGGIHPPPRQAGDMRTSRDAPQAMREAIRTDKWAAEFDAMKWGCGQVEEWLIDNGFSSVVGK
jgi:hypothetical protein